MLSLGRSLEIVKDLGDAETVGGQYGLDDVQGHPRDRARPDGDRVRGRHLRRAPVLGVSVLGRRGRPQRPADELLHVAPPPRALRPPVHVGVRLGDHRRLPRREDERRRLARRGDAPLARRARRRLHLHRRHRRRARRRQGRARREAARALRVGQPDGASPRRRSRSARSSTTRSRRTTPTSARCWCGNGRERISYDARGLAEPHAEAPNVATVEDGVADLRREGSLDPPDQPRAPPADLRGGRRRGRRPEPAGAPLARGRDPDALQDHLRGQPRLLRLRADRRPRDPHQGPGRLVVVREHDERRRRRRLQRRLAHGRRDPRRRPRRQGSRRRAHRHRPEGRHDHRRRLRRLDDRAS